MNPWIPALAAVTVLSTAATPHEGAPQDRAAEPKAPVSVHWTEPDGFSAGVATGPRRSSLYRFSTVVAGKPVRWNPCQVIRWRYNPAGQPRWRRANGTRYTGFHVVRSAVAQVAKATGTRWVYDGTTRAVPSSRWLPTSTSTIRPVLIGWTDGRRSDLLRRQPARTLAVARTAYFKTTVNGRTLAATKGLVIALDRTDRLPGVGAQSWRTVALHELAHGMGLSHVGSRSQLMYPMLQKKHRELQRGDRLGLRRLGRSQGCINLGF